ncbi:hypothetical protein DAPPUDRAFT_111356 [Daphnia pulex]|uniref:Uncharacterized protein n=1 Tax=Daphnia pulex TaxID=6669 RepID=E9H8X3_DAPPU|nr:hypothetical protein DAPPUDRAFT_111356 [Daphnia pulex]|eukprot:EFX71822.1 hypothetical protein DAPPUDRAFT_111356 [Daphnia pulex]
MDCCICEISITGCKPQIIECVSCRGLMHRQCMPTSLSSTEYVRMKKDREVFNFQCVKCVGGVIVSAEPHQPVKRRRGRPLIGCALIFHGNAATREQGRQCWKKALELRKVNSNDNLDNGEAQTKDNEDDEEA